MMTMIRVVAQSFCAGCIVNEKGMIYQTAPILRKFSGQHLVSLKRWCEYKGFELSVMGED